MGWRLFERAVVIATCVTGCAAIAGLGEGPEGDSVVEADAVAPPSDARAEPPPAPDVADRADGEPCKARDDLLPAGAAHARRASSAPEIDGNFAEWSCIDTVSVGLGAATRNFPPGAQALSFAFQWTPEALYFYAQAITTVPAGGFTGDQIYRNDSVELILARPPVAADGGFQPNDHQLIFDTAGRNGDFNNGMLTGKPVNARVTSTSGATGPVTFKIEARIPAASFGVAAFAAKQTYLINFLLVDSRTDGNFGYRVWRLPSTCPCTGTCCNGFGTHNSPACDTRCTESLVLD